MRNAGFMLALLSTMMAWNAFTGQAPTTGSRDAKVTIVEYSDFACIPYCAKAHETMKELLKQYSGKIRLVYKYYPLTRIHPWGVDAAVDAACVHEQDQAAFWKLSDYLFAHQKEVNGQTLSATVLDFAQASGLDVEKLKNCMMDLTTMPIIQADLAEAERLGFNGAPVFVINGRTITGAQDKEVFSRAIEEALAAQK